MQNDLKITSRKINIGEKEYHFDPKRLSDTPRMSADFVSVVAGPDSITLVLGHRQDAIGIDTDIVDPTAILLLSPVMAEKLANGIKAILERHFEEIKADAK